MTRVTALLLGAAIGLASAGLCARAIDQALTPRFDALAAPHCLYRGYGRNQDPDPRCHTAGDVGEEE